MTKTFDLPSWGAPGNMTGYTFKQELNAHVLRNFELFIDSAPLDRYPSVYYRHGHATLDHKDPDNIGWVGGEQWECLFFGNVTDDAVRHRPHGNERNSEGEAYATKMAARFSNYCANGRWARPSGSPVQNGPVRLLEIWKRSPGDIWIHKSRNPFYWVDDNAIKSLLHTLATTAELMKADRQDADRMQRTKRDMTQPAVTQRSISPGMQNKPHPV